MSMLRSIARFNDEEKGSTRPVRSTLREATRYSLKNEPKIDLETLYLESSKSVLTLSTQNHWTAYSRQHCFYDKNPGLRLDDTTEKHVI